MPESNFFPLTTKEEVDRFLQYFREFGEDDFEFEANDEVVDAPDFLEFDVGRAEFDVLSYYSPDEHDFSGDITPGFFPEQYPGPAFLRPQLRGWRGEFENPDIEEMDDRLVQQIRFAIAETYEAGFEVDEKEIDRITEGDRNIRYDTRYARKTKPWTRLLRKFDVRQQHHFL